MSSDGNRDIAARLAELEATVRGLTQELVSAEERIRQLEDELERDGQPDPEPAPEPSTSASDAKPDATADGAGGDKEPELEDIIVA